MPAMPEPMMQMSVVRSVVRGGKVGREVKGSWCTQTGSEAPEVCMNFEGEGVVVAIFLIIRFRGGGKGSLLLVSGDGWGLTSWCRKRGWRRVMRWMVAGWARCQSILFMDSG